MQIDISGLAKAIEKELEDYSQEVTQGVNEAAETVAKDAVKELKRDSPKKTGKYARSWTNKSSKNVRGAERQVIHNKKYYRISHLLEKGYAKRGGGRVKGRPHIKPVEEKAVKRFEEEVRKAARG